MPAYLKSAESDDHLLDICTQIFKFKILDDRRQKFIAPFSESISNYWQIQFSLF